MGLLTNHCAHASTLLACTLSRQLYAIFPSEGQKPTSVEIWFTSAELGNFVLAFPVRFTPRLYTDEIKAARARIPVVIDRQKN